jgi:hypothetical protein
MVDANEMPVPPWPRTIAIILAVGGSIWGAFLILAFGPAAPLFLPFSIGYMVTAGYVVRAVSVPPLQVRRVIWAASILVQGGWLVFAGLPGLARQGPHLFALWWAFATVCSVVALAAERETPLTDEAADYDDAPLVGGAVAPERPARGDGLNLGSPRNRHLPGK